jgi:hypothetical protein
VHYDWQCEDGVWYVNTSRYRVLEIYYDAKDSELPDYIDPVEESIFLSQLPRDVVEQRIWPLICAGER